MGDYIFVLLLWKVSLCGGSLSFLFLFLPPVLCHSWDYNLAWFPSASFPAELLNSTIFGEKKRIFFRPKLDKKTINIRREKSRGRPPVCRAWGFFEKMEPRAKPVIFEIKALIFSGGYFMDKIYSFELLPKAIAYLTLILFLSGTRARGIFL